MLARTFPLSTSGCSHPQPSLCVPQLGDFRDLSPSVLSLLAIVPPPSTQQSKNPLKLDTRGCPLIYTFWLPSQEGPAFKYWPPNCKLFAPFPLSQELESWRPEGQSSKFYQLCIFFKADLGNRRETLFPKVQKRDSWIGWGGVALSVTVLLSPHCWTELPHKSRLREGLLWFTVPGSSPSWWGGWGGVNLRQLAGYSRKQSVTSACVRACLFSFSSRNGVVYTVRVLTSVSIGQVVPRKHAQRCLVEMMLVLNNWL